MILEKFVNVHKSTQPEDIHLIVSRDRNHRKENGHADLVIRQRKLSQNSLKSAMVTSQQIFKFDISWKVMQD